MGIFMDQNVKKRSPKQELGKNYETVAERFLIERGFILIERNFSCRMGEIDLIMRDKDTLVFLEVRFRSHSHFGDPLETVTRNKQKKISRAAQYYLIQHKLNDTPCRFDVIGISSNLNKKEKNALHIQWVPAAFLT